VQEIAEDFAAVLNMGRQLRELKLTCAERGEDVGELVEAAAGDAKE